MKTSLQRIAWLLVFLFILDGSFTPPLFVEAQAEIQGAYIYTDSSTYFPGEQVSFHGRDFAPWVSVAVGLWMGESFISPIAQIEANETGTFDSSFSLSQELSTGLYSLRANSQMGSAETTFALAPLSPGILVVTFQMQGASLPINYTASFLLTFFASGTSSAFATTTITCYSHSPTSLAGSFSLTSAATGLYDLQLKEDRALSALQTGVVVVTGTTTVDFNEQRVGDANGDDVVNILDFALLKASFSKTTGQAGFDPRADFNGNRIVNATDFVLLKTNFGKWGPL